MHAVNASVCSLFMQCAPCEEKWFQEREEDREPASDYALWDSVIDGSKADLVYPEIFHFDQKIIMHFGEQPYHPANRRVTLRVHLKDLKLKYGLRDEAIIHIVTVLPQPLPCRLAGSMIRKSSVWFLSVELCSQLQLDRSSACTKCRM